jgi:L-arabinose transport system permease protein
MSRRLSGSRVWLRAERLLPIAAFGAVLVSFLIVPGLDGEKLNQGSYYNSFQGFASLGLITLAVGLPLIAGEFDVSVLGMQALGGVLAVRAGGHSGALGVAAAIGGCALLGLFQGTAIARLRLASLPVTIGTYIALLGLTNVIAANNTLTYGNISASVWVDQQVFTWFSPRSLIAFGAFLIAIVLLGATRLGPELKAMGSDRRAGRVAGVAVERRVAALFTCSAALAGLAGALFSYSSASASLDPGLQPLILAVVAAVLGGVSLSGGRGTAWGLLLGALAVALLQELFSIIALSNSTIQIVFGCVLLFVVSADAPDLRTTVTAAAIRYRRVARVRP